MRRPANARLEATSGRLARPMGPAAARREPPPRAVKPPCDGILEAIGDTPLLRLRRFLPAAGFDLYAKLEALNPAGSLKDRPARAILQHALAVGAVSPGGVIVESSSGNMGIGLAQVCRFYGLRFICVVDPKTTPANLAVMQAYGAEIDYVAEPDPETGEFLQARIKRVRELVASIEGSFWPNQYESLQNPEAHYDTTMREISDALDTVDFVFVPTSTCGTVRGCAEYVRDHGLPTRVVAVDAVGSVIFSDVRGKRVVPGLGAGIKPPLCEPSLIDDSVHVTDLDCVVGCRLLIEREAVFAGGSSGGVLSAVATYQRRIPAGAAVVALLPDRGERYLDTIFCDDWVRAQFGDVAHLWREAGPAR
jgi:cysteine synthase A